MEARLLLRKASYGEKLRRDYKGKERTTMPAAIVER